MKDIRIGLIGCGGISNTHLPQYAKCSGGVIYALCDINEDRLNAQADKYGVPKERRFTDYRDLIACEGVDAVDICTPNDLHVPMAHDAINAGKHICVEKPLGISYEETVGLKKHADEAGIKSMVCFSYRFMPAVRYAKHLIDEGFVGRIVNIYASYLKSSAYMPGRRLDWRFDKKIARYGVSGDLGVHMLDMTTFLCGDVNAIAAQNGIAVPRRKKLDSEEYADVTTDDWCHILASYECGAGGTFSITRAAYGNRNHISADIYGEKGGLRFDLNDNTTLEYHRPGTGENDMEKIKVPKQFFSGQQQCFIDLLNGRPDKYIPTLADAVKLQKVLDAILTSDEEKRWIEL